MRASSIEQSGHSKEKRSDCPLLIAGCQRLCGARRCSLALLSALQAPKGALVVMDRGITQDNITWLAAQGYRLVVSRERKRTFDLASAMTVTTATQQTVGAVEDPGGPSVLLFRRGNKRRRPLLSASPSALRMP